MELYSGIGLCSRESEPLARLESRSWGMTSVLQLKFYKWFRSLLLLTKINNNGIPAGRDIRHDQRREGLPLSEVRPCSPSRILSGLEVTLKTPMGGSLDGFSSTHEDSPLAEGFRIANVVDCEDLQVESQVVGLTQTHRARRRQGQSRPCSTLLTLRWRPRPFIHAFPPPDTCCDVEACNVFFVPSIFAELRLFFALAFVSLGGSLRGTASR